MDADKLEKYSSAFTLADMEVFVFPELMYSLVLANIMSPILWKWRDEDSFAKLSTFSLVFAAVVGATSLVLIVNSIRIAMFARRREIEVMKLVGATNWFIRWPFVFEGALVGVFGAKILVDRGYADVTRYPGGIVSWKEAGYPLSK